MSVENNLSYGFLPCFPTRVPKTCTSPLLLTEFWDCLGREVYSLKQINTQEFGDSSGIDFLNKSSNSANE